MRKEVFKHRRTCIVVGVLLALLIMGLAGSTSIASAASFSDVPSSSPYYAAITSLADKGIVSGYTNGKFGPNEPVKRAQFAKMIVGALELSVAEGDFPNSSVPFVDLGSDDSSDPYPHEYVAVAAFTGLTRGKTATTFDPYSNITRAQVVTMVVRAGGSGSTPPGWTSSGNATRGEVAWMLYTLRGEAKTELKISAASSLKGAYTAIGQAFDASHHTKTAFNFDASGTLQKQIEAGANVDVFAAAAGKQPKELITGGFAEQSSYEVFASNGIVLAVPANSTLGLASFTDLTKSSVTKIGYGDPAVAPHGVYAEEVLTKLGIFSQVKPKVIYSKNASETLTWVKTGEVQAGIMFSTDAIAGGSDVKVAAVADKSWHSEIVYPAVVVSASKNKALAQAFIDFLTGPKGQQILRSYGFLAP